MTIIKILIIFVALVFNTIGIDLSDANEEVVPFYKEVQEILAPLQYSGLNNIIGKKSKLSIDFNSKKWFLHNTQEYDKTGKVLLNNGNSGLCGKLSRYVYSKIEPLFPKNSYDIKFILAKEADYFYATGAVHILLIIKDLKNDKEYILDPTFKRYGLKDEFKKYLYIKFVEPKYFIENSLWVDKFFVVDHQMPLLIRKNILLNFSVETVNGKFDSKNFVISIVAVKPQASMGEYVFALRNNENEFQFIENSQLINLLLSQDEQVDIKRNIINWFMEFKASN